MLTLLEAAKLVTDPLKRGVIEIFPRTSPVWNDCRFSM